MLHTACSLVPCNTSESSILITSISEPRSLWNTPSSAAMSIKYSAVNSVSFYHLPTEMWREIHHEKEQVCVILYKKMQIRGLSMHHDYSHSASAENIDIWNGSLCFSTRPSRCSHFSRNHDPQFFHNHLWSSDRSSNNSYTKRTRQCVQDRTIRSVGPRLDRLPTSTRLLRNFLQAYLYQQGQTYITSIFNNYNDM